MWYNVYRDKDDGSYSFGLCVDDRELAIQLRSNLWYRVCIGTAYKRR